MDSAAEFNAEYDRGKKEDCSEKEEKQGLDWSAKAKTVSFFSICKF